MDSITLTEQRDITAFYRGSMIQSAIELELRMDIIIGRYLSSNTQENVLETISIFDNAESIGIQAKNTAIQYILKKHFNSFLKEHTTFLADMDSIIRQRNIVAHKRPSINTNDYSILSWAKTKKNSIEPKSFELNEKTHKEYLELCANMYYHLIKVDVLVTNLSEIA